MSEETMKDFEQEINESFNNKKKLEDAEAGKWEGFEKLLQDKTKFTVKITEVVKAGCVALVEDVRAFIPASHLSTQHVENLEDYLNKELEVIPITVDQEKRRLVLSHREVERGERRPRRNANLENIHEGDVKTGKVESIKDYGAFIDLGDNVTGLLHVSQISYKRVKTPADVLKEGQEVEVKVLAVENGRVSLSMKALQEPPKGYTEREDRGERRGRDRDRDPEDNFKYEEKGKAVTSLGDLLKDIKL